MFNGKRKREERAIAAEVERRIREERVQAEMARRKKPPRVLSREESAQASRMLVSLVLGCILVVLSAMLAWHLGEWLGTLGFLLLTAGVVAALISFRSKIRIKVIAVSCATAFLISGCIKGQSHDRDVRLASQRRAEQSQEADREASQKRSAQRNHEARLAYNLAHPAEAAKMRAESRLAAAQRLKEQREIEQRDGRRQSEEDRIAAIPYGTRLSHANADFNRRLGNHHMFESAVILHTYVKDDAEVVMVDDAAWHHLSEFEHDAYTTTIESDWNTSCVSNFACDKDDPHSANGRRSLNYQFTSYFDGH